MHPHPVAQHLPAHARSQSKEVSHASSQDLDVSHAHTQNGPLGLGSPLAGNSPQESILSRSPRIQAKVSIGAPDDVHEREADAVADQVVQRSSMGADDGPPMEGRGPQLPGIQIQRKCASCEEEQVQRKTGHAPVQGWSNSFVPFVQRKCAQCQAEDDAQTSTIQRKVAANAVQQGPSLHQQLGLSKGLGQPLPQPLAQQMGNAIGADFAKVRIHDNSSAALMSASIQARAFTHGADIYFNQGQYNPATTDGKHLLAHELTHVVQQQQQQQAPDIVQRAGPDPDPVSMVIASCISNKIVIQTLKGSFEYDLATCDLVDGEYQATVNADEKNNQLGIQVNAPGLAPDAATFSISYGPGQVNPITLFGKQTSVKVKLTRDPNFMKAAATIDEFKSMVKEAGKFRMEGNKKHLEEWKVFFTQKLTPAQVAAQVTANRANHLAQIAAKEGGMTMYTFNQWANTANPYLSWVQEQQIEGRFRACTGCHFTVQAQDVWRNRPPGVQVPPTPVETLQQHAANESANPAPRFPGAKDDSLADLNKFLGYDAATDVMMSVKTLRPYLDELGVARYNVLPLDVFTGLKSNADLLGRIAKSIQERQDAYDAFKKKIDEPDFDYLQLRPIVQDLLLFATPEVQAAVQAEIASAAKWETVKAIAMGAVTIGLIILAIFPPTSVLGAAGVIALEAGAAGYGLYSGIQMYEQGALFSQGQGADDVIDPEQQKSADTLMAMGLVNIGLSVVSLGTSTLKAIKLVRTVATGTKAAGAVASIEATLENGNTVKITEIGSGRPKISVLGKDGKLLNEATITEQELKDFVGSRATMDSLKNNGIEGATPRAGTAARPVANQGRKGTCGPVSCEMMASTGGGKVSPKGLTDALTEFPKGAHPPEVVKILDRMGIVAKDEIGGTVQSLATATKTGEPAMAVIKTTAGDHGLHWVVVDGVTTRMGVKVVAIRNPWGIQYFQSEEEFAKIFTGQMVKIEHWKMPTP